MKTLIAISVLAISLLPLLSYGQTLDFTYNATATSCGDVTLVLERTGDVKVSQWIYGINQRLIANKGATKDTVTLTNMPMGWLPFSITVLGANGMDKIAVDSVFVSGSAVFRKPSMELAFCEGETGALDVAANLSASTPIKWIIDGSISTSRAFSDTDDKTYLVSSANGSCTDTLEVNIDVIQVAPSFVVSAKSGSAPLTIIFQSTSEEDADEFEWNFGTSGALSTNTPSPTFTYTNKGTYDVTLYTSKAGTSCKDSVTYIDFINAFPTNISEPSLNALSLYPNPTASAFTLVNPLAEDVNLTVYTTSGQEILKTLLLAGTNQIDLSNQEPGVYLLKAQSKNSDYTWRVTRLNN